MVIQGNEFVIGVRERAVILLMGDSVKHAGRSHPKWPLPREIHRRESPMTRLLNIANTILLCHQQEPLLTKALRTSSKILSLDKKPDEPDKADQSLLPYRKRKFLWSYPKPKNPKILINWYFSCSRWVIGEHCIAPWNFLFPMSIGTMLL